MSIVDSDALDLLSQASQVMGPDAKARIDAVLNEVLASGLDISKNPYDFFFTSQPTAELVVGCIDGNRRVTTISSRRIRTTFSSHRSPQPNWLWAVLMKIAVSQPSWNHRQAPAHCLMQ